METNQMMTQEDEIVIDVKGILIDLWRKTPLILLIGILTAAMGFAYASFALSPTYESSTKMYVLTDLSQTGNYSYMNDLQISTQIIQDCAELITSRYVAEKVIEDLKLNMSNGELLGKVAVGTSTDTRFVVITVVDTNPVRAKQIADEFRIVSAETIQNVMGIQAVNTVDEANLPTVKSGPNVPKYTVLGALVGLVLMCGIFIIRFILNDAVRTPDDIENKLGLSVLAVVPQNPNIKKRKHKKNKKN